MFGKKKKDALVPDKIEKVDEKEIQNDEKRGWGKPLTLWQCILLDAIGMLTYIIPAYAEVFDIIWAPLSSIILLVKFGRGAMPAAVLEFVEELIPFTDFIPTFTLTYLYRKFYKAKY